MELRDGLRSAVACLLLALALAPSALAQRFITVASTTSTEQSGLFKHLLPIFEKKTGIQVRVVALGTGQALDLARRGDADVVFVHAKSAEEKFVARRPRRAALPRHVQRLRPDRAESRTRPKIAGGKDTSTRCARSRSAGAPFVSRGDRSGTHIAEVDLWTMARHRHREGERPVVSRDGAGHGPGAQHGVVDERYILADRATWLAFKNRGDLAILVEGDKRLFNQYGVMLVNPEKHPSVKRADGQAFIDWLVSAEGQKAIAEYKIGGEQLFFPNAGEPGA